MSSFEDSFVSGPSSASASSFGPIVCPEYKAPDPLSVSEVGGKAAVVLVAWAASKAMDAMLEVAVAKLVGVRGTGCGARLAKFVVGGLHYLGYGRSFVVFRDPERDLLEVSVDHGGAKKNKDKDAGRMEPLQMPSAPTGWPGQS